MIDHEQDEKAAGPESWSVQLPRRASLEEPDLDITPMIDITFLLLIFFLVASTPDIEAAAKLPEARHGAGVGSQDSVIFTVAEGGLEQVPVYLGDGKQAGRQLSDNFQQQRKQIEEAVAEGMRQGKPNVLIKADRGVAHREVARVVAAASRHEGVQIHLAVKEVD